MNPAVEPWDYLIVTASSGGQAAAYEARLRMMFELGLLAGVRQVLVVPDPGGRRVGSGGSTIHCLLEVLGRELGAGDANVKEDGEAAVRCDRDIWWQVLRRLRILIVHAGGDSMRLPAYGPFGKAFIPVGGESDSAIYMTLFARQVETYLRLPSPVGSEGQVVVAAGDDLKMFEPSAVELAPSGVTALGCHAPPEQASRHGVFCVGQGGMVRRFLQKPPPAEQEACGAVDRYGRSVLDVAVMAFDLTMTKALLEMSRALPDGTGKLVWTGAVGEAITSLGLDLFREICCAMGTEVDFPQYVEAVRASGSLWDEAMLACVFEALSAVSFTARVLPRCRFLHFGTTREIISSGTALLRQDRSVSELDTCVSLNNDVTGQGRLVGANAWVEGCCVGATLTLGGENVVVGLDVDEALSLPPGACLDVIDGRDRGGRAVRFVRCYGVDDQFKDSVVEGATFCGRPIAKWLAAAGATPEDVWDDEVPLEERRVWDARLFPAETEPGAWRRWLWMFDPSTGSAQERAAWRSGERYSLGEIAELADHEAFHERRARLRTAEIRRSLRRMFRNDSGFSADDLSYVLARADKRVAWVAELLAEAHWHYCGREAGAGSAPFVFSRIIHTLASALARLTDDDQLPLTTVLAGLKESLGAVEGAWLETLGLGIEGGVTIGEWVDRARAAAFEHLALKIVGSERRRPERPRTVLRRDEIVWGRAPARLELAGGWTDTPPYSLEHGGRVVNAAVNLNGQPPIQAYARVIDEPVIRIASIDLGERVEIGTADELLDYGDVGSSYGLAKAALALSGLAPDVGQGETLEAVLERFGGGIELTTLAAIPKGSGLGTSSIMGAVLVAVVQRVMGRTLTSQELFHDALRLEQAVRTGGGWQDQIGGAVDGVKIISTGPGLVPDAVIHYVPPDVVDPRTNDGQTLLYYTGITRLAKDILERFVRRYLDRDRRAMATLEQVGELAPLVAETIARKDLAGFGKQIDEAWRLHKLLNPEATNEMVEELLARVRPHVSGARISGAGGGGFLFMVAKSPEDAAALRRMLESEPPNERARFFDFDVSREGLVVTVC